MNMQVQKIEINDTAYLVLGRRTDDHIITVKLTRFIDMLLQAARDQSTMMVFSEGLTTQEVVEAAAVLIAEGNGLG